MSPQFDIKDGVLVGIELNGARTINLSDAPSDILEIAAFVFNENTPIEQLTLNNKCTTIRNKAFFNCKTLKTLVIGTGLSTIEEYAFAGCNNLTSITGNGDGITANDNVLYSGTKAILGANGDVSIQGGTTEIGNRAFSFCDKITEITIPSSVTKISDYAFSDCKGLSQITIPGSTTDVGYGAFFGCDKVTDVKITATGSSAVKQVLGGIGFAGMQNLIVVHVPTSVKEICTIIGEETFANGGRGLFFDTTNQYIKDNTDGSYGTLPSTVHVEYVFGTTPPSGMVFYLTPGTTLAASMAEAKSQIPPDEYDFQGWYYDSTFDFAAKGTDKVSNYRIDDEGQVQSVSNIYIYAKLKAHVDLNDVFYTLITEEPTETRNYGLVTLTGVKDWEKFRTKLYEIPFSMTRDGTNYRVTVLGPNLFEGGTLAATMEVPWTVKRINKGVFKNHTEVTEVTFPTYIPEKGNPKPSQLTTIDAQAFAGSGITEITIPTTLTKVRSGAFARCSSLTKVTADSMSHWLGIEFSDSGSNPLSNGGDLYLNSSKVTTIDNMLIGTVTEIKPFTFSGCTSITSVDFSNTSVTTIGEEAFTVNSSLSSVTLTGTIRTIGRAAFSNTAISSITVPSSLVSVGEFMFNGCAALETANIYCSIVSSSMFSNCPELRAVTIGKYVATIGKSSFAGSGTFNEYEPDDTGMEVTFADDCICTLIDDYAFAKSGVVSIIGHDAVPDRLLELPSGIVKIGTYGFEGCSGLYDVYMPTKSITFDSSTTFANCPHINIIWPST